MLAAASVLWALGACTNDPLTLELNFPSTEAFLYSEQARVLVFELGTATLGDCPALVAESLAGSTSPARTIPKHPVCDYEGGGVSLGDVGEGPMAWVAVVEDGSSRAILAGCTVAEVYADAPDVVIHLAQTSQYFMSRAAPPTCSTVVEKCGGGCGM
jgi:hypothetical protein